MEYREHAPPSALSAYVQCVWRLRGGTLPGGVQTIYPDGRCELLVHLASPPRGWNGEQGWKRQARTLFAAQHLTAVRLELSAPLDCIGVRLQPAASNLFVAGAAARRDRVLDLRALDAPFARALARAARSFARGVEAPLWNVLVSRVGGKSIEARVQAAISRIERSGGRVRMDALAREAALSMRGFQIRFQAAVGLTPKEFARLARLQATLRALDGGDESIAALAGDGGFADQAHATRELRRVTGLTPARLRSALRRDRDGDAAIRMAAAFVRGQA
ncbi:MAG TPA: AraC family transcriptional regulator [Steroidobacteraceae bacterium]|nr:AraC family transcriptional regulator [Steroidobacteraceae bacterium]